MHSQIHGHSFKVPHKECKSFPWSQSQYIEPKAKGDATMYSLIGFNNVFLIQTKTLDQWQNHGCVVYTVYYLWKMNYKASTPWLYFMTVIKFYNPPLLICSVQSDITVCSF